MKIQVPTRSKRQQTILATGAEGEGNFSIRHNDTIYYENDFGDLRNSENFDNFQKTIFKLLKKLNAKPDIIVSDLHPLYVTTELARELATRYKAKRIQIQHHVAHIYTVIAENAFIHGNKPPDEFYGIAMDGTGYGIDNKIWGGEALRFSPKNIKRLGHLENQTLIGANRAVEEPARLLFGLQSKVLPVRRMALRKIIARHYDRKTIRLLRRQLAERFNCQETSSTARVLDAIAVILDFSPNRRDKKHGPVYALEQNSTRPYKLYPKIKNGALSTTHLFEYILKNIGHDKKRLAATAQLYIAEGLYQIIPIKKKVFYGGGMARNKIISKHLSSKGAMKSKKIPCGDNGISFGQLAYTWYQLSLRNFNATRATQFSP